MPRGGVGSGIPAELAWIPEPISIEIPTLSGVIWWRMGQILRSGKMLDIVIIGVGGHAREVAFLIEEINRIDRPTWNLLGFVEADGQPVGHQVGDYSVICNESEL